MSDVPLNIIPSIQTTWERCLVLHPDTLVLDKRGIRSGDSYEGVLSRRSRGILEETNSYKRLPGKKLVLGMDLDGNAIAYSFSSITQEPIINDTFNGDAVLVTFDPLSETDTLFFRNIDGRSLTFKVSPETGPGILLMQYLEAGSVWQALNGRAIGGELVANALERLPSH